VKKLPLTLDCIHTNYDITQPQPQLFVTPDFPHLTRVLEQFAETMAYRLGGAKGLDRAIKAKTVTTTVLDSGAQISGKLTKYRLGRGGEIAYLFFDGPCQLAHGDRELDGQGPAAHAQGFSTPLGKFKQTAPGRLEFESGVVLEGKPIGEEKRDGRTLVMSFTDCTIRWGAETLYQPEWGRFDLACGARVTSVFGGPADRGNYYRATGGFQQDPRQPKTNLTEANRGLNELYARVRALRESSPPAGRLATELARIWNELSTQYPHDWLLAFELLELARERGLGGEHQRGPMSRLAQKRAESPELASLIERALETLS
jgi:phenylalanine-4-hydroxylase